jgi:simple sugar transport system permease protein
VFQVAPFPLMIFALVMINLLQRESVQGWVSAHPLLQTLIRQLQGSPPRALGKSYRPD